MAKYINEMEKRSSDLPTIWKSHLYELQQQAPVPKRIICQHKCPKKPPYYGREFHGMITREQTDVLLKGYDGSYLVRESQRAPGTYTLCLRFGGVTKNFKLYYDGKHYVGEKRFDTIQDLVADGLISLFLESKASDYIAMMCSESNYELSPYMTLTSRAKRRPNVLRYGPGGEQITVLQSPHEYERPPSKAAEDLLAEAFLNNHIDVQQYEKQHNFKVHNFKGLNWCDFCGNFMWGLIAQGVKCEDCGFSAHRKCSESVPNDCCPDLKYVIRVFGVDLTTLVKARNTIRPFVVDMLVKEIERRGIDIEGLYRVSGFNDDIEAVKAAIDKDGENAEISPKAYEDINVIAGVLKLYFRLLPIPLITFDSYQHFISAVKKTTNKEKMIEMSNALSTLPPAHYQTLKYLIAHLYRVSQRYEKNKMSTYNLSTVFCPTLMRSPDLLVADLAAWKYESTVIEFLLSNPLLFEH
ncbi:N-chimaerin, variant 2 [Chamberlinius hualienensis]